MRPSRIILTVATLLVVSSYTIVLACDHATTKAPESVQAVGEVSETNPGSIDVTITCEVLDKALNNTILLEAGQAPIERQPASAMSSIRAGVNLTRALSRAMAHLAVAMARTAYHTVTALT